jgi:hypothetical protein
VSSDALPILQAVRLKGRIGRSELADKMGVETTAVDRLVDEGLLVDAANVRLTPSGRERLGGLLAAERATVDAVAAGAVYDDFSTINAEFKPAISQWQLTRDPAAAPGDAANIAVLTRVDELHRAVVPVIEAAGELVPRLAAYAPLLAAALARATAGDMAWLSRPIVDSYHTVWFELHEELIGLAGRTRADEAESGNAD